MNVQIRAELYKTLYNIGKALEDLKRADDENVRHAVQTDRENVTKILSDMIKTSLDERLDASNMTDEDWFRMIPQVIREIEEPFKPVNAFDMEFYSLIKHIWTHSRRQLVKRMVRNLYQKRTNPLSEYFRESFHQKRMPLGGIMFQKLSQSERPPWLFRLRLKEFFAASPFWGTFDPEKKDYNTFERRALVLKNHSYDFLWLYQRLEDYLSKKTLCAILQNWVYLETRCLKDVKSIFPDYWEPDIFPDNKGDVLVDCGAYTGDSIKQYVEMYGKEYHKIYAYDIAKESYTKLCQNMDSLKLHDVICRCKGTGREKGKMFVDSHDSYSGNHLCSDGNLSTCVEVVPLDEDVEDTITFLKMDIEGAEFDTLLGCKNTIRRNHPKLAVCVYHGYDDIWRIPLLIHSMYPDYHFHMRYNGDELFPTEFVLLCKD